MNAIDLFAGAGGFSTGAVLAGCQVLWAANHWPIAVEWHTTNHPGTVHACQDLQQADFRDAPAHDILLADLRPNAAVPLYALRPQEARALSARAEREPPPRALGAHAGLGGGEPEDAQRCR